MDLKEAELLGGGERRHWYYVSKARALERCLADRQPTRILDVGAGSGFFSRVLLRDTRAESAVCVDPGYAREWTELEGGKTIAFRREARSAHADVVLMMDVLEHVDDDVQLMRHYADAAAKGTRFVISVPAFSWLWSDHDVFLEHRRRYTLRQVLNVVTAAELSPLVRFYFFGAILPAVAAARFWHRLQKHHEPASDLRRHHPLTNTVLSALCRVETRVALHNRAFGLTAFVVAEKR